jgi:hypothetical protein
MAELVDALDLGSSKKSCGGSSPPNRRKKKNKLLDVYFYNNIS